MISLRNIGEKPVLLWQKGGMISNIPQAWFLMCNTVALIA